MYSQHWTHGMAHTSNKQINQCTFRNWKDGLVVKRTLCSCKLGFGFQHPHDTFYLLPQGVNFSSREQMLFSGFHWYYIYMVYIHITRHIHVSYLNFNIKIKIGIQIQTLGISLHSQKFMNNTVKKIFLGHMGVHLPHNVRQNRFFQVWPKPEHFGWRLGLATSWEELLQPPRM